MIFLLKTTVYLILQETFSVILDIFIHQYIKNNVPKNALLWRWFFKIFSMNLTTINYYILRINWRWFNRKLKLWDTHNMRNHRQLSFARCLYILMLYFIGSWPDNHFDCIYIIVFSICLKCATESFSAVTIQYYIMYTVGSSIFSTICLYIH